MPRSPEVLKKSNMRILLIVTNLTGGGAERALINLASGLVERGHRPHILLLENLISYAVPDRVQMSALTGPGRQISNSWLGKWWAVRALKRTYRRLTETEPFDLTISTLPFADQVVQHAGLPNVWYRVANTLSSEVEMLARTAKYKAARRRARYRSLYNGQRLIAVSNAVAADIVGRMAIEPLKLVTIYNPFDHEQIRKLASAHDPDIPAEPFLLHVGRFQPQKRHDLLLDAFKASSLPHRLALLTKPSEELSRMIAARGLQSRVTVFGFRQNPFPWYARADAVVLSSDREGMPNVLVEALICNTPVVSTDCPSGPAELLRGAMRHWLVPCDNVAELAAKMREVVEHRPAIDPEILAPFSKDLTLDAIEALAEPVSGPR